MTSSALILKGTFEQFKYRERCDHNYRGLGSTMTLLCSYLGQNVKRNLRYIYILLFLCKHFRCCLRATIIKPHLCSSNEYKYLEARHVLHRLTL